MLRQSSTRQSSTKKARVQNQSPAHRGLGGVKSIMEGNNIVLDDIAFTTIIVHNLIMEEWFRYTDNTRNNIFTRFMSACKRFIPS
jgi:hypothetical protein